MTNASIATDESVTAAEAAVGREDAQITELAATAEALTIETAEQLAASSTLLMAIKGRQKEMEQTRQSITRPMDAAKKGVLAVFKPAVDRLASAEQTIKNAVLAYHQVEEERRREAQAKLDADAARERERLARVADEHSEAGHEDMAEVSREIAEMVVALSVAAPTPPPTGVHTRITWHAEVDNLPELAKACAESKELLHLIEPNMTALNSMARTLKEGFAIPGVKAVSKQDVTARA